MLKQNLAAINSWFWSGTCCSTLRRRTIVPGYGDLNLGGTELEKLKWLRIRVTLDSKLTLETYLREVVSKTARSLGSCAQQESYLIAHVCSRAVAMHMFCSAWSIVPPCGCCRRGLIWVCWIILFAVRKDCVKVSFVVWGTGGRSVPCVYSIRFITEQITLWISIWVILLQLAILEIQLL